MRQLQSASALRATVCSSAWFDDNEADADQGIAHSGAHCPGRGAAAGLCGASLIDHMREHGASRKP
ncbi:hypothetical protein [Lampropedia aestuarii]|uniref:hypothetical protein n=1 Tax=Lampropedia aestuarii TaxID=2562762 RepID=UPI0014561EA6|nr:hypothetical protein [Lampropedia aestuarii]